MGRGGGAQVPDGSLERRRGRNLVIFGCTAGVGMNRGGSDSRRADAEPRVSTVVSDPLRSTIASYDSIAGAYEARNADAPTGLEAFRSAFVEQLRPAAVVADLGCGPGRDVAFFAERGLVAVGVDASKEWWTV